MTRGFADFARGKFEDGGSNLYVNANGAVEMIHRWDVNNDGYPDLVLANSHDYIERGPTRIYSPGKAADRNWQFQQLPTDSGWMSRIIDLDQDGFPDLLVANGENGVSSELPSYVYWGGPAGLGAARTNLPTRGAYDVAVMDINHDGKLDLIFPSAWSDHHNPGQPLLVRVYLAGEKRTFTDASERFGIEGTAALSVATADLNGDGFPDLAVANYRLAHELDTSSLVYWGARDGVDTKNPLRLPTHGAQNVLLADLNHDGAKEIIFSAANQVQIYWSQAEKFDPANQLIIAAPGLSSMFSNAPVRCAVGDVDQDGKNDLILAASDGVQIRSGSDLGRVKLFLPVKNLHWLTLSDLDGDGRLDLIASRYSDGIVYDTGSPIFWNGPAGFSIERITWVPTMGAVGNTAGDLDGDGRPELVFNNTMSGHLSGIHNYIYLGNKNANYGPSHRLELPTDGSGQSLVADLDLDGYPEGVFIGGEAGALRIYHGGPEGPSASQFTDIPANEGLQDIQVADFNRDGYLDLLGVSQVYNTRPETLAKSARIYYGSKEGYTMNRSEILPMYGNSAYLADVNRDGYLDVLFTDKRNQVLIYLGGSAGFSEQRCWTVPVPAPLALNTADLNADGWLDLIVSCGGHYQRLKDTLHVFYGGPKGFSADRSQELLGLYTSIFSAVADYNHDGNLDMLATAYSTPTARVLPAQIFWGNGKTLDLEHPVNLPAEGSAAVTQIDLNRDGWVDLVLACHRNDIGHQVDSLIYWNGPRGFSTDRVARFPGLGPHGMTARDRGNSYTREPVESYFSEPFALQGRTVARLHWDAEMPPDAELKFQLRWAANKEQLEQAEWRGPKGPQSDYTHSAESVEPGRAGAAWVQYRAKFVSPYGAKGPALKEVRVELKAD